MKKQAKAWLDSARDDFIPQILGYSRVENHRRS